MMHDDKILVGESRKERILLQRWREALKSGWFNIIRSKIEDTDCIFGKNMRCDELAIHVDGQEISYQGHIC